MVLSLKKNQIWFKNPKISFRQFKLTLAERGHRFFYLKKTKCLRSNKNVNVAFLHSCSKQALFMALENIFYFNFKVLSRLPNRNKARKLLKFAVFDIFLSSQIVCCSYVRYMYILNQSTNYYTFIV